MILILQQGDAVVEFFETYLPEAVANIVATGVKFVIAFVIIYLIGRWIVMPVTRRVFDARDLEATVRKPLEKVTKFAIVFVAFAVAFAFAGLGNLLSALATLAAAATLAIGIASQDIIGNLIAGIFIYTDKPFKIGDWIEWDAGTYSGVVEDISLRVTRVRTFDNELLTVPNAVLTDDTIKNPVAYNKLRIQVLFGIGYDDDIERATEIIIEETEVHPGIMDEPEPTARLTELADSYVGITARLWIDDPNRADLVTIRSEYVTAVKERFDANGIEIPFPQRALSGEVTMANVERAGSAE